MSTAAEAGQNSLFLNGNLDTKIPYAFFRETLEI
jgi:hypothetical protein